MSHPPTPLHGLSSAPDQLEAPCSMRPCADGPPDKDGTGSDCPSRCLCRALTEQLPIISQCDFKFMAHLGGSGFARDPCRALTGPLPSCRGSHQCTTLSRQPTWRALADVASEGVLAGRLHVGIVCPALVVGALAVVHLEHALQAHLQQQQAHSLVVLAARVPAML